MGLCLTSVLGWCRYDTSQELLRNSALRINANQVRACNYPTTYMVCLQTIGHVESTRY